MGVAPHKRNERLLVEATTLNLHFSIPVTSLADAPVTGGDGNRLPKQWVEDTFFLWAAMLPVFLSRRATSPSN